MPSISCPAPSSTVRYGTVRYPPANSSKPHSMFILQRCSRPSSNIPQMKRATVLNTTRWTVHLVNGQRHQLPTSCSVAIISSLSLLFTRFRVPPSQRSVPSPCRWHLLVPSHEANINHNGFSCGDPRLHSCDISLAGAEQPTQPQGQAAARPSHLTSLAADTSAECQPAVATV
jgi:hypothetical protein